MICATGKRCFASEEEALAEAATGGIYLCPSCECYHRTRAKKWKQSLQRADATRARMQHREQFSQTPLAQRLPEQIVNELLRISERP